MGTRIRIMNLEVDLLTEENLQETLADYLSNEYLNVVHLVSMEYANGNGNSEVVDTVLAEANLVLPGEKTILSTHHVNVLEAGEMVVCYKNFVKILGRIGLEGKKCYFVMRNKNEAKSFYRLFYTLNLDCECVGVYTADGNVTDETLINDINTQVPDLIFLSLDRVIQEQWIADHKAKLNSKLCICLGAVLPMIRRENPSIPKWIQILHINEWYKKFIGIPTSNFFRKRIFKKKMANYNNKKAPKS